MLYSGYLKNAPKAPRRNIEAILNTIPDAYIHFYLPNESSQSALAILFLNVKLTNPSLVANFPSKFYIFRHNLLKDIEYVYEAYK